VVEAGSGTVNGIEYAAALGSDIVRGVTNAPPYNYSLAAPAAPVSAVASTAAMDGGDGGWPLLYGANPVTAGNLALAYDEDQIANSERNHTTEQVAYMVFGSAGGNLAPTASFTDSCDHLDCNFTDTSTDNDGTVVTWLWDFGDGNGSSAQNPSHTYAINGDYTVSLTVTDDDGDSDNTSTLVSVIANVAPTAGFTDSCNHLDCNFTDTSSDSDGTVVTWLWDFGDGNGSNAQNPSHTYAINGDYTVSLTVTDDDGDSDSTNTLVSVTANVAPTAGFTDGCDHLDCNFTDTSSDSDGTVVTWLWDFGDGNGSNAQNPSHTYATSGDYTVSLTVTDDEMLLQRRASPIAAQSLTATSPIHPATVTAPSLPGHGTLVTAMVPMSRIRVTAMPRREITPSR
jgi:PKD repeat protein